MPSKTRKKITFVWMNLKPFWRPWYKFKDETLPSIRKGISLKYKKHFSDKQLESPALNIFCCLSVSFHCEALLSPTYEDQLSAIYDFRQFLKTATPCAVYINKWYSNCFNEVYYLLNERSHFNETKTLSSKFFRILNLNESLFPMENAELYLDYIDEVARATIKAMTDFMEDQIYIFLPSEGPDFYNRLSLEANRSSNPAHLDGEESSTQPKDHEKVSRRVAFSCMPILP